MWNFDVYLRHIGGPRRHIFGGSYSRIIDYRRPPQAADSTWKLVNALRTVTTKLPAYCDATVLDASALQDVTNCGCSPNFTERVKAQTFKFILFGDTSVLKEYHRRKFHSQNPSMINEVKCTNSIKTGSNKLKFVGLTFCNPKGMGATKFPILWCDFVMSVVDDESV